MSKTKPAPDEAGQLLIEGARSYLDAMVAIQAFRNEVYRRCTTVVVNQLPALSKAIGFPIAEEDVKPDYRGEKSDESGNFNLSVKAVSKDMIDAGTWFYAFLAWWDEDNRTRLGICVGLWLSSRVKRHCLESHLKRCKESGTAWWDLDETYIWTNLEPAQAGTFEVTLSELLNTWISLGNKCGSFRKLLAANS